MPFLVPTFWRATSFPSPPTFYCFIFIRKPHGFQADGFKVTSWWLRSTAVASQLCCQHRGPALGPRSLDDAVGVIAVIAVLFQLAAGDGVLRRGLRHRPHQEHKGEHLEGGVDRLHLQRDFTGTCPEGAKCWGVLERRWGHSGCLWLCRLRGCRSATGRSLFSAGRYD